MLPGLGELPIGHQLILMNFDPCLHQLQLLGRESTGQNTAYGLAMTGGAGLAMTDDGALDRCFKLGYLHAQRSLQFLLNVIGYQLLVLP